MLVHSQTYLHVSFDFYEYKYVKDVHSIHAQLEPNCELKYLL